MIKAEFSSSLLQSSVSRDPSEIILICATQETFLIIISVDNICSAQYFCGNWYVLFFRLHRWIESLNGQNLFEIDLFCNSINVLTVTVDQFNVSLFYLKNRTSLKPLNTSICPNWFFSWVWLSEMRSTAQRCLSKILCIYSVILCPHTRCCSVNESRWCWKDYATHMICIIFHAVSSLQVSVNFGPHFKYPPKDIKYQPVSVKSKVVLNSNTFPLTILDIFLLGFAQIKAYFS